MTSLTPTPLTTRPGPLFSHLSTPSNECAPLAPFAKQRMSAPSEVRSARHRGKPGDDSGEFLSRN